MGINLTTFLKNTMEPIKSCIKCSRIYKNFLHINKIYPEYYNEPILASGSISSAICIIGLAPGLHGANRTGIPFHGDFSGEVLYNALRHNNLLNKNNSSVINNIYITNAVKCYPPSNKPTTKEINNCLHYLSDELNKLKNLKIILALGSLAHYAILKSYNLKKSDFLFKHGNQYKINKEIILLDSYHCSKININTKRLTIKMLNNILKKVAKYRLIR